jgi:hypothetical protein
MSLGLSGVTMGGGGGGSTIAVGIKLDIVVPGIGTPIL